MKTPIPLLSTVKVYKNMLLISQILMIASQATLRVMLACWLFLTSVTYLSTFVQIELEGILKAILL